VLKHQNLEGPAVRGVAEGKGHFLVEVKLARPSARQSFWDAIDSRRIECMAPQFTDTGISFFTERESENELRELFTSLSSQEFLAEYRLETDWAPVSVVGDGLLSGPVLLGSMAGRLDSAGIPVRSGASSAIAATLAVPLSRLSEAAKVLHDQFSTT
jgi:aspartokinase